VSAAAKLLDRLERVKIDRAWSLGKRLARHTRIARRRCLFANSMTVDCYCMTSAGAAPMTFCAHSGWKLFDLFPWPVSVIVCHRHTRVSPARDLLEVIDLETYVVQIVAGDMANRRAITAEDFARLQTAAARIHAARGHLNGR